MDISKFNYSSDECDTWRTQTCSEEDEEKSYFLCSQQRKMNEQILRDNTCINIGYESDKDGPLRFLHANSRIDSEANSVQEKNDMAAISTESQSDNSSNRFLIQRSLVLSPHELAFDLEKNLFKRNLEKKFKIKRGFVRKSTSRKKLRKKKKHFIYHSKAKRSSLLLTKKCRYRSRALKGERGASDNLFSALFTTFFCFPPLGLAALYYSIKVRILRDCGQNERARRNSLIGRKLANTGIMIGMTAISFVVIYFLLKLDIPYFSAEYEYYIPDYEN